MAGLRDQPDQRLRQVDGPDVTEFACDLHVCTDKGRDADQLPGIVKGQAATVARIERRIGLNDIVNQPARGGTHGASKCADDPSRKRVIKPEGIADSNRKLSDTQFRGIPKVDVAKLSCIDTKNGKVSMRVSADNFSRKTATIHQGNRRRLAVLDNMVVGHDVAIRRENKS